ncbi:hypothetical protein AALP_AA4G119700 [Arabis alpina]|uniref:RING-type E3 ubiquitin transferase n=1 Tax=Arabis alpina TaxID=50452 RepID=A0A087H2Q1_ARAAL|nr:hypothetical protein AALP_AA4G119700 [Arabis alpina]
MVILQRNIRLLLQSVASESTMVQQQPETETKLSDIALITITIMFFALFVMALASVCFRWSTRQLQSLDLSVNWSTDSNRTVSTAARGIDAAIVNSFPTFLYSEVKERRIGKGGVECAVCLCEFEDAETLRLMPNCCHVFHSDCVSAWLFGHSTCPLCRVDLGYQPGEVADPDSTDGHLLDGVTWTNRNRPFRSESTRFSRCRVSFSERLFSRSHSTGHCNVKPAENQDRFTLRLPDDVRSQLMKKTVDHVELTQVRSSRRAYRSTSVGSESRVLSDQWNNYNNRRLHSKTFSFSDFVWSNSCRGDNTVAPSRSLPRMLDSGEPMFERHKLGDQV